MPEVDAVVIGAGHNGLVAANKLADAGWSVVVLEGNAHPGGAVRSGEIAAPGYVTDICSAFFPLGIASPHLRSLGLADYGLQWRHAPVVLAHVFPDGRAVELRRNVQATAASVELFAPGDGDRWLKIYEQWREFGPGLMQALFTPFPPVTAVAQLAFQAPIAQSLRTTRQALLSARRLGEELFNGAGARALIAGCTQHSDLGPGDAGGGVFGWLLCMLGQQVGFPVVAGGAGALTDALVSRLRAHGGEVECNAMAEHVVVRDGRARGVRTVDGREWSATRAVIADVPAPALYQQLVAAEHLPSRLLADLDHFAWGHATLKIDWALEGEVPWQATQAREAGVVHFGADIAGLARYSTALANREVPAEPFIVAGQMTTADPSRSPAGTQALWAYTHLPYLGGHAESADVVAEQVERVEQCLERHAPGFRARIRGRYVHDPLDMEQGNPSLVGGTINGGSAAVHQQLVFRPTPGLGRADTPIDQLFLASASAHPSGGVHGGPGANAARAALARAHKLTGWLYGAGIRTAHKTVFRDY
ncbi:MAG: NAD(P)/FAD-dependent oxidoreductase [Corynebacteriales bacterium]|nr:NAD(P)/FAD-dependent oxidoreductase [Mycobacteriales bacterium]